MNQFMKLNRSMSHWSLGYAITRNFLVRPMFYLFYRRIQVIGVENVPKTGPVIFTPNHQNALMDAICILCTRNRQPVFVARADIFQGNRLITRILYFLRILPIFRKRDGVDTSDSNRETFDILLHALHHGQTVGIMPEGVYSKVKRLGILQKGVFRMAMQAQERFGNREGVKIVPVGLEYSDIYRFRSDVIIRYGKPISMADYFDLYLENPAKAFKKLQDTLSERMKEGMINIDITDELKYMAIDSARRIYEKPVRRLMGLKADGQGRLTAQQTIIAALEQTDAQEPEIMQNIADNLDDFEEFRQMYYERPPRPDNILTPWSILRFIGTLALLVVTFPLFVLGLLCNYLPYSLCIKVSYKLKDRQFVSSAKYVASLIFFPIWHLLIAALLLIFVPCIYGKIAMVLLIIPSGIMAFNWFMTAAEIGPQWGTRILTLKYANEPDIKNMRRLRGELNETVMNRMKKYLAG